MVVGSVGRLVVCSHCGVHIKRAECVCPHCAAPTSRGALPRAATLVMGIALGGCPADDPGDPGSEFGDELAEPAYGVVETDSFEGGNDVSGDSTTGRGTDETAGTGGPDDTSGGSDSSGSTDSTGSGGTTGASGSGTGG